MLSGAYGGVVAVIHQCVSEGRTLQLGGGGEMRVGGGKRQMGVEGEETDGMEWGRDRWKLEGREADGYGRGRGR